MRVAIIGGKLQGVEAAYLARKAGWKTLLVDQTATPPAIGLCDEFLQADLASPEILKPALAQVDCIIPALEDRDGLASLQQLAGELACPVCFDFAANALSCSKSRSYVLFEELGLSIPALYPGCGYPLLVKPDGASGSKGVTVLADEKACERFFGKNGIADGWVGQQFLNGPSYSLEVIGHNGQYVTPQITEIVMDAGYDCKAVLAPAQLSAASAETLWRISLRIAQALDLSGIMDVEVIAQDDQLYLLEIDARLPSQTPITVYWSTGVNMLETLVALFKPESGPQPRRLHGDGDETMWVRLEHIRVASGVLTMAGEHLMAGSGPLHIQDNFFGTPEAITDYQAGKQQWCATLIHTGTSLADLQEKHMTALHTIKTAFDIYYVMDSRPVTNIDTRTLCHDPAEIC